MLQNRQLSEHVWMPFGLTADEPAVHIEKAVGPDEFAGDRSSASESDQADIVGERVDIPSDGSEPEFSREGEGHSPIDLSIEDSDSSDNVETDEAEAKDDETKHDIPPPPPKEPERVLEPGLVSYSKETTSKAKYCICADPIQEKMWRLECRYRAAKSYRLTRYLHGHCAHLLPVETRRRDYRTVLDWAAEDGLSLEASTFLDNLDTVFGAAAAGARAAAGT